MKKLTDLIKDKDFIITIKTSETADTRTCDYENVSVDQLLSSSKQHIKDVQKGMNYIANKIKEAGKIHDFTKLEKIDLFHKDFINGFKTQKWYDIHKKKERHHIAAKDGVRDDIDLIDVIEFLVDGVMAGLARSGEYRKEELPKGLLQKAFDNTVDKMIKIIKVENNNERK